MPGGWNVGGYRGLGDWDMWSSSPRGKTPLSPQRRTLENTFRGRTPVSPYATNQGGEIMGILNRILGQYQGVGNQIIGSLNLAQSNEERERQRILNLILGLGTNLTTPTLPGKGVRTGGIR